MLLGFSLFNSAQALLNEPRDILRQMLPSGLVVGAVNNQDRVPFVHDPPKSRSGLRCGQRRFYAPKVSVRANASAKRSNCLLYVEVISVWGVQLERYKQDVIHRYPSRVGIHAGFSLLLINRTCQCAAAR